MTADELEDLAFQNRGMPKGLNAAEQMMFQSFRRLYAYAKLVQMPPEQGKSEKMEILREFDQRSFQLKRMEHNVKLWKEIDAAASRFAKERTVESAEDFVKAVYGVGLKEAKP